MSWKLEQAKLRKAAELGETVAGILGFERPPIDPFAVIASEDGRIRAVGDYFGNAFDGRLEYHGSYFLLFFNTKYNEWHHEGEHHPKVRFTVGHELVPVVFSLIFLLFASGGLGFLSRGIFFCVFVGRFALFRGSAHSDLCLALFWFRFLPHSDYGSSRFARTTRLWQKMALPMPDA